MAKSEKPIRDGLDEFYKGTNYSHLAKDNNYSTGDSNMTEQRRQTHAEAVQNERAHYDYIHPFKKPRRKW